MRAVVQRVARAAVRVGDDTISSIGPGLLVLVGVATDDDDTQARALADKVRKLRVFPDDDGVMNRSVEEAGGEILVVSQFTLFGDARRGNRPSYIAAAQPEHADRLYSLVGEILRTEGLHVSQGRFGAHMTVESSNDGPVTILLDTRRLF